MIVGWRAWILRPAEDGEQNQFVLESAKGRLVNQGPKEEKPGLGREDQRVSTDEIRSSHEANEGLPGPLVLGAAAPVIDLLFLLRVSGVTRQHGEANAASDLGSRYCRATPLDQIRITLCGVENRANSFNRSR